jgi:hypothetical protein
MAEAAHVLVLYLSIIAPPQQLRNPCDTLSLYVWQFDADPPSLKCCALFIPRPVQCQDIFLVLRRELERRDLLVKPKVHISPSCGTEVQRLREYVRRLQGQLAESPGVLTLMGAVMDVPENEGCHVP